MRLSQVGLLGWTLAVASVPMTGSAQAGPRPRVQYVVEFDERDSTRVDVGIFLDSMPPDFQLAMAVHPEEDNRYWKYLIGPQLIVSDPAPGSSLVREDSTLWRVRLRSGRGTIFYGFRIPVAAQPANRAAWRSFRSANGALLVSSDIFLYLPDVPGPTIGISIKVDSTWRWATGLPHGPSSSDTTDRVQECSDDNPAGVLRCKKQREFHVTDFATLIDSPILLGKLHLWDFSVANIPHTIAYWAPVDWTPFDSATFTERVRAIATESFKIFGKAPYASYNFLFQDRAFGALEHRNSVTIGLPSADVAKDPNSYLVEIAHEFFHTWNLVALHPDQYLKLSYKPAPPTSGIWFGEGVTMYYAYLIPRRMGFPAQGRTRIQQLEDDIGQYFSAPGNFHFSPEQASRFLNADPSEKGDWSADYYLVGRLIGEALQLIVSDSTHGKKGMDDVIRTLYDRRAGASGYTGADIEWAASDVCGCSLHQFFSDHVRAAKPFQFGDYLRTIGLRLNLDTVTATDTAGHPVPDTRVWAYAPGAGGHLRLQIFEPSSVWGKAGLHTGTELAAFNGRPADSLAQFRRALQLVRLGDVVPVDVIRNGQQQRVNVTATSYTRARARISELPGTTALQRARRAAWLAGKNQLK